MWFEDDELKENSIKQPIVAERDGRPIQSESELQTEGNTSLTRTAQAEHVIETCVIAQGEISSAYEAEDARVNIANLNPKELPSIDELKSKFGSGQIPQASDFQHLIELAALACSALGLTPGNANVSPGQGLSFDKDYKLHAALPSRTIVMFHGETVPSGWALCNGENGTPNLLDRFVIGGNTGNENGQSNKAIFSGPADNKSFVQSTLLERTGLENQITSVPHPLSLTELPKHAHTSSMRHLAYSLEKVSDQIVRISHTLEDDANIAKIERLPPSIFEQYNFYDEEPYPVFHVYQGDGNTDDEQYSESNYQHLAYDSTSLVGGGEGHSHDIRMTDNGHCHNVEISPPYIILAYIMKL